MRSKKNLVLGAALLGVALLVVEYGVAVSQQKRLRSAHADFDRWTTEKRQAREQLAVVTHEQTTVDRGLGEARARLAALEAAPARLWAVRVKLLKELLAELPTQGLPEIRLLDDLDWINAVRKVELDTPGNIRAALATLRAAARMKFAKPLQDALKAFTDQSGGRLPSDISELARFLLPPADAEMLTRYSLARSGMVGAKNESLIVEKSISDMILSVSLDSWGVGQGPNLLPAPGESEVETLQRVAGALGGTVDDGTGETAQRFVRSAAELMEKTFPRLEAELGGEIFGQRMQLAAQRFRETHPGEELTNLGQLLPHLDDSEKFVAAIRPLFAQFDYMKEHEGRLAPDAAQLKRYLERPFNAADALATLKVDLPPGSEHGSIGVKLGPK